MEEILEIINGMIKEETEQAVGKLYPSMYDHKREVLVKLREKVSRVELPVMPNEVIAGELSEQTLIELGFEKEPDGMYYERGWINKNPVLYISTRKITKKDFWEYVVSTIKERGEEDLQKKLKKLLGF